MIWHLASKTWSAVPQNKKNPSHQNPLFWKQISFFIYIIFCLKNKTALQFLHQNLQIFFPSFGILLLN